MEEFTLCNNLKIPKIGYGSAIVLTYMYGSYTKKTIIKYWIRNFIKNKKQYQKDKGIKKC